MGRLRVELLDRIEQYCDRVVDVVETLEKQQRPRRIIEQLAGCGTSVGANAFEADEAVSRAEFCKIIAICLKELNETRFWLRMSSRRNWIPSSRLAALQTETDELRKILGAILSKTRQNTLTKSSTSPTSAKSARPHTI